MLPAAAARPQLEQYDAVRLVPPCKSQGICTPCIEVGQVAFVVKQVELLLL